MSNTQDTLYLKIAKNSMVKDRHVKLSDVATMTSTNQAMVRQLKQLKIYSFPERGKKSEYVQVMSALKVIEMIQKEYPNADISNEGEADFVMEYEAKMQPGKASQIGKAVLLCLVIFFSASFSIMAFNNDISITQLFDNLYQQVTGFKPDGVTELEICYSIGLPIGVIIFFNHFGNKKITNDPTPIQVEMRKYEKDVDDTYIENAGRGGEELDVD